MLKILYNHFPYTLKKVAASVAGTYRKNIRYDKHLEERIFTAFERESWTADQWMSYREEKISKILFTAYKDVPFYREQWAKRRISGDKSSFEYLENWPVLDKQSVRQSPQAFLRRGLHPRKMYIDHTSGTSGTPLTIYQSKETIRSWYALFEARWRRWYGVDLNDRWAIFGGQLVAAPNRAIPPFWVWNAGMRQLYCSSYHISESTVESYLNALKHYEVVYLLGYASSIYSIAVFGSTLDITPPKVKLILNNAEPLYEHQLDAIKNYFGCDVKDTYGMSEMLCAASECEHGKMHLWPEVGVQEVNADGELISTGLLNLDMPLIRYKTGDKISFSTEDKCLCGRTMPVIDSIEGRMDDSVITRDGRRIGRLDPVFKADLNILEAQIIQESLMEFTLKLVPGLGFSEKDENYLVDALRERVGDVKVCVDLVDAIPRTKAGKFKAVISKVKRD